MWPVVCQDRNDMSGHLNISVESSWGTCDEVHFNAPNRIVRNLQTDLNSNSLNLQDKNGGGGGMRNSENPVIFRRPFTLINVVMTSSDALFTANCV
jgi:hypothetical protein